jgi:predicted HTH transcriptional regulator
MEITQDILDRIGQPESGQLEYKAVLPPAATVAQLIGSFANTNGGGIVLGVVENGKEVLINGLSDEFRAVQITRKAIDMLSPPPAVSYDYVVHQGKRLFVIDVKKSDAEVSVGRQGLCPGWRANYAQAGRSCQSYPRRRHCPPVEGAGGGS